MRTLAEARSSWQQLQSYNTIADLKAAIHAESEPSSQPIGSRSLLWKIFLLFEGLDHNQWLQRSTDSRSAYASVRSHLLRGLEHPEEVLGSNLDPLSEDTELSPRKSPWAVLRQDETLRAEIMQDVDRCMPDNIYFRQPHTQSMLLDVLFVFCKLNPDVGYRQGMHELLAPILWVIEKDAISSKATDDSVTDDKLLCHVFDSDFIEHDTFTLFGIVMQGAKSFYEQAAHKGPSKLTTSPTKPTATLENPILTRIHRIFDEYLPHVDPSLAHHLQEIDLIPQVFLMRWIRLLFGREFGFDEVLCIWDSIFAEDPSLEMVDLVCLNMILRLHWDLMDADYNTALTLLLRYPALEDGKPPQIFATDALYLKQHFNQFGASTLIEKYSGRPLPVSENAPTASIQPQTPKRLGVPKSSRQSSNFEHILQDAAKGVFQRGEKWGINKALRDAMDEVRKGVREIQAVQTPSAPPRHNRTYSRQSGTSDRPPSLQIAALEQRNAALAKMLKTVTDDLWEYHRIAMEGKDKEDETLKNLSLAIAKVQFTQVYLEDTTIPLPLEEETDDNKNEAIEVEETQTQVKQTNTSESQRSDDSASTSKVQDQAKKPERQDQQQNTTSVEETSQTKIAPPASKSTAYPVNFQAPRPTLAQSSFSWMLGQTPQSTNDSFARAKPLAPSETRRRSKGFLFGDEDGEEKNGKGHAETKKDSKRGKDRKKMMKSEVLFEQDDPVEEEFDLGALEEEDKVKNKKAQASA